MTRAEIIERIKADIAEIEEHVELMEGGAFRMLHNNKDVTKSVCEQQRALVERLRELVAAYEAEDA